MRSRTWPRAAQRSELDIATALLDKTQAADGQEPSSGSSEDRWRDPGYFLISTGRIAFEREIGYRVSLKNRLLRGYVAHATHGLPRQHRRRNPVPGCLAAVGELQRRCLAGRDAAAGAARGDTTVRGRGYADQPLGDSNLPASPPAAPGSEGGRAAVHADFRGGPHHAVRRVGGRGERAASGDSLPLQSRRRCALRPCCPTGSMRTPNLIPDRRRAVPTRRARHRVAQPAPWSEPPTAVSDSFCFIAAANGARRSGSGWAGSANAASCTNSIVFCAARQILRSCRWMEAADPAGGRTLRDHARRGYETADRRRCGSWSAPPPIR